MTEEKSTSLHPISALLCEMYRELVAKGQVSFPLHDEQIRKLDSVVKTVHASYFGFARYSTPRDKAAAYFTFIIKDHPVTDGNKRLAVLMLELCCIAFELNLSLPDGITLDQFAVSVENSTDQHPPVEDVRRVLFGS